MTRISTQQVYAQALKDLGRSQSEILKLQAQIGSGKRILSPADDPVATSRALDVKDALAQIDQYRKNSVLADQRLALEETALEGVTNLLVRVKAFRRRRPAAPSAPRCGSGWASCSRSPTPRTRTGSTCSPATGET